MKTLILATAAVAICAGNPAAASDPGRLDRIEDRIDRRESYVDRQVDNGRLDRIEDVIDRRENVADRLGHPGRRWVDRHERRSWYRRWGVN